MKTIGIVGSRRRNARADYIKVQLTVYELYEVGDKFVSGGCPSGGDRFAEMLARDLGATITIHHADWKHLGRVAGFARNGKIAADADVLVACVAVDRTGGTEDTIQKFKKLHPEGEVVLV